MLWKQRVESIAPPPQAIFIQPINAFALRNLANVINYLNAAVDGQAIIVVSSFNI